VTTDASTAVSAPKVHSHCLLCGHRNSRSLNLVFHADDEGVVEAHFHSQREFQGYDGLLHGGVIAALLDAAMTHCLFHHGIQALTGDLHVRYKKPISCDASLGIRAWLLSSRPPLYRLKAEIVHDKRVKARAEAVFMKHRVLD
jgi:acyl-coenzyme A thioesterase PaaI-like protein